jgi:HPt (histidine-containing phosphotransfer) domain-containing protein
VQATPVLLDSVDGLERILGNRRLYGQLLRRFQHDHAQAALALGDLLKSGNYDAALCMAHRLKGAAGMIGARAVEKMAGGIEENLRQLVPAKPELLLPELQDLLLQTGDVIAAALTELPCDETVPQAHAGAPDTAAMTMTHQEISDVANRLACLLDEGDGEAIDLLDSSASALAGLLGVDKYQEVAAAAHEFDFEAALGALRRPR